MGAGARRSQSWREEARELSSQAWSLFYSVHNPREESPVFWDVEGCLEKAKDQVLWSPSNCWLPELKAAAPDMAGMFSQPLKTIT